MVRQTLIAGENSSSVVAIFAFLAIFDIVFLIAFMSLAYFYILQETLEDLKQEVF